MDTQAEGAGRRVQIACRNLCDEAHFVTGSRNGDTLLHSAQNRKGGLHTTARPSLSG